jgi:hypothetical protein
MANLDQYQFGVANTISAGKRRKPISPAAPSRELPSARAARIRHALPPSKTCSSVAWPSKDTSLGDSLTEHLADLEGLWRRGRKLIWQRDVSMLSLLLPHLHAL